MSDAGRGMPLLSGPPPPTESTTAEIACRKCNKEFNLIFARARRCNHCGMCLAALGVANEVHSHFKDTLTATAAQTTKLSCLDQEWQILGMMRCTYVHSASST